jgi:RES domain-containing protein
LQRDGIRTGRLRGPAVSWPRHDVDMHRRSDAGPAVRIQPACSPRTIAGRDRVGPASDVGRPANACYRVRKGFALHLVGASRRLNRAASTDLSAGTADLFAKGHALNVRAWCTGPAETSLRVTDLGTDEGHRWSEDGQPTLYVAGDEGVVLAELGRHWSDEPGSVGIWKLELHLECVLDLRRADVRAILGGPSEPRDWLAVDHCRAAVRQVRDAGSFDGIVVPSVAFLDDPSRWNAVVFLERLRRPLDEAVAVLELDRLVTDRATPSRRKAVDSPEPAAGLPAAPLDRQA